MHLTHLSVHGFKSFAHPVTIEFTSGLNVIVGPNGSGKSNIIDALRWVLGDNFREMRVSQGKEVIFHGAAGSKPLGMAFIETNWSDGGHSSYSVGRRIFASGESEYFLNQNRLRLKDLKEKLRKLGFLVDSIGVTVVDNNKLQTLFDFRPAEKFSLFEMASGTFNVKEKLSMVKSSLNRIGEKISRLNEREIELKLQVDRVSEHARQEEKYLLEEKVFIALRKEYFNFLIQERIKKVGWLEQDNVTLEKEMNRLESEINRLDDLVASQQDALQQEENLGFQLTEHLQNLRDEIRSIEQQVYFHLTEARQREKTRLSYRQGLEESQQRLVFIQKNLGELQDHPLYRVTLEELEKEEKQFRDKFSELRIRKDSLNEQKNKLKQELTGLDTSIQYLSEEVKSLHRESFTIDQSLSAHLIRMTQYENQHSTLKVELEQLIQKKNVYTEKIARKKTLLSKVQTTLCEYDRDGKIDEGVAELLKKLIIWGWPGKVVYAFNWLFKDQTVILDPEKSSEWEDQHRRSGRNLVRNEVLPPSPCWQIFPSHRIIEAFYQSTLPDVNMISPDGNLVYRRDGVLIFPRKLITSQSGGHFYQSWQRRAAVLQKNARDDEKKLSILLSQENELERQIAQKKGELQGLKLRCDDLTRDKKRKVDKLGSNQLRKTSLECEKKNLGEELDRMEWDWDGLENEIDRAEERLRELQKNRFDREKIRAQEEKLVLEDTTLQKQMERAQSALGEMKASRVISLGVWRDLSVKFAGLNESYRSGSSQKEATVISVQEFKKKLTELRLQRSSIKGELDSISRKIEKLLLQIDKSHFEIQELTSHLNEYQEWNTENVEIPHYSDHHHLDQIIQEKERRLKNWEIRRGSIAQLRELKERQTYLEGKIDYFKSTLMACEKTSQECERLCQDLFYEFLTEVNLHFQKNFQTVFDGGRAKIEIEDQNLDIVIQIPGKKKQKLSLLSSGEKALTALCLFFALFKSGGYRFCFFDEVDATLDHFNSIRLADLIKEFSQECQVIIVTHQEEIMEVSDRIIGITMDEPGVSQVVPFSGENLSFFSSRS